MNIGMKSYRHHPHSEKSRPIQIGRDFLYSYFLDHFAILQTFARDALSGDSGKEGEYPEECYPESDVDGLGGTGRLGECSVVKGSALGSRSARSCRHFYVYEPFSRYHEHDPETDLDNAYVLALGETDSRRSHEERYESEDKESVNDARFVRLECIGEMKGDVVEIESQKDCHDEAEKHTSEQNSPVFWAFLEEFDEFEHRGLGDGIKADV